MTRKLFAFMLPFVLLLLVSLGANIYAATTTTTGVVVSGMPRVTFTVDAATTGDVVATDSSGAGSKRGQITRTGGVTMYELHRFQRASNGIFVDCIAAPTTATLATRIAAFDFTTSVPGHPSPTHDAVDDALATAMVGYTGS